MYGVTVAWLGTARSKVPSRSAVARRRGYSATRIVAPASRTPVLLNSYAVPRRWIVLAPAPAELPRKASATESEIAARALRRPVIDRRRRTATPRAGPGPAAASAPRRLHRGAGAPRRSPPG